MLSTVAGVGIPGDPVNGAVATRSSVAPSSLAKEYSGNLLIADGTTMSVVPAAAGLIYGQQMVKGHLYRIAAH
jgi:hypothetical protein